MASPSFFQPNFIFQTQSLHEEEHPYDHNRNHHSSTLNPFLSPCTPHVFSTGYQILDFAILLMNFPKLIPSSIAGMTEAMVGKRSASFSCSAEAEELSDDRSQRGRKKSRLNMEQVRALEKNFELGNKLEPERKMQLAASLGLQPSQIAIWFQNRRARWKTKQLEKDYDLLQVQFRSVGAENDALRARNQELQAQILALKGREAAEIINLSKENEGSCSNRSNSSSEINLERSLKHSQSIQFLPAISQPPKRSSSSGQVENGIPDEHLSILLCGMEDQTAFRPWPDHHHHHHH